MAGNKKISELSTAGTLDGTELVEIIQSSDNVKVTTQDIADLATGGGITGVAAVGDILRVKTIGVGGVVIDLEPTNNTSSQFTENTAIVSEFGQIDRGVQGVNGSTSTQITENKFQIGNTPTVGGGAVFIIENGDYYFQSVSIPIASTGFLTVALDGKIGVGSAGATGTFTSNDGKTITVTDGIITAIV